MKFGVGISYRDMTMMESLGIDLRVIYHATNIWIHAPLPLESSILAQKKWGLYRQCGGQHEIQTPLPG
jgi:hypothetical protein